MDLIYVKRLMLDEGRRPCVYDDATGESVRPGYTMVGHPTIGFGRALDVHELSDIEMVYLLDNDVTGLEADLAGHPWWAALDPLRQYIVVNMALNMGMSGVLQFVKMIAALKTHSYTTAGTHMLQSRWAAQLPARSGRLATEMRTGVLEPRATL